MRQAIERGRIFKLTRVVHFYLSRHAEHDGTIIVQPKTICVYCGIRPSSNGERFLQSYLIDGVMRYISLRWAPSVLDMEELK